MAIGKSNTHIAITMPKGEKHAAQYSFRRNEGSTDSVTVQMITLDSLLTKHRVPRNLGLVSMDINIMNDYACLTLLRLGYRPLFIIAAKLSDRTVATVTGYKYFVLAKIGYDHIFQRVE